MNPKLQHDRPRLWFLLYLGYRMNLVHHRGVAVLTIVAVALAAALATGLEIASRGVREQLHSSARAMLGGADLEVVGTRRGIPEELVERVAAVDRVFEASPVISETVRLTGGTLEGVALTILGLDLLAKSESRELSVSRGQVRIRDPLRLLVKPSSIVIARSLATRLGVREGESFRVRSPAGLHDLAIEGLIEPGGLGDAFAGQIGVMDVWALQHLLDARGYVDKIEIRAEAGADLGALVTAIGDRLAENVTVRRVMERDTWIGELVGVLDVAAAGIALLSALIATLLAFAAISHVVDSRTGDFALMRCAGMDDRGVRRLIVVDSLLLSGLGAALGVAVGTWLSGPISGVFSRFSDHFSRVPVANTDVSPATLAAASVMAAAIALAAGARPAWRAARVSPLEIGGGERSLARASARSRRVVQLVAFGVALLTLFTVLAPPLMRLPLIVMLGVALLLLLADRAVALVLVVLHLPLRLFPRIFELAGSTLLARRSGRTLPTSIVASVVGGAVAVLLVLDTVTSGIDADIERRYRSGAAVYPGDPASGILQGTIMERTVDLVRATAGVTDVAIYYNSSVPYGDHTIVLGVLSTDVLLERGGLGIASSARDALLRGEVLVSQTFKSRFGVDVGDSIELQTRSGLRAFRVCGVRSTFGSRLPSIGFDVATFDEHFVREGASFLGIWTSRPLELVLEDISRRTADMQPLFFRHGAALRNYARSVAGRFRGLLLSLGGLCILTSSLGLASLLSSAVIARRSELMLMSTGGATPREINALVVIDGCVIVAIGTGCGVALGVATGMAALELVSAEFGWALSPAVETAPLVAVVAGIALGSTFACFVPAGIARRGLALGPSSSS